MSKLKDETGNQYGYWTVIKRAPNNKRGQAMWECKCKCGNTGIVNGISLRNGHSKSCGCYQKEQTSKASMIDLTGQTIGNFTILSSYKTSANGHLWKCRCNLCGNDNCIISTTNLTKQESCGCLQESKGTRKIKELLDNNNISYITEKRFSNCRFEDSQKLARFDFYIPDQNYIIEYDGRQHFIQGNGIYDNEEKFNKTQEHDLIKNNWCKQNNIPLIRIPYTHFNDLTIEDLRLETSKYII